MEVKLDKRYPLDVDSARAWKILSDVPATAGCMPGAAITDKLDDTHYKGNVKVKVGPASAAFAGDIEVLALDAAAMTLQLLGKGADRGGSSASMNLTATIEPGDTPATSVLVGHAEVIVNGKFAQFGGRLMVQVSDMLLGQFVDNFRIAAAALPMQGVATATAAEAATEPAQTAATTAAISPTPTATPFVPPAPAKVNEINALAIFWHLVKGWFSGLFGGKRA
ncbi:SRPBCC family protein [Variovorax sp. LG9.2]|uniref:SRPBCC family protein n=1 Tax=Variovorax sp. LG9.2 TaxID=3048626 RepID=UPI002B22D70C|nr:SRPBCC family protein [Variovorax sp. LG9.2]MEB0059104.1 SRPBCC family protein [Variovorax sp. LG9.2]